MEFPVILIDQIQEGLSWPDAAGRAAWVAAVILFVYLAWRARGFESRWTPGRIALLAGLLVLSAAAVLFGGIRVPLPDPLILPGDIRSQEDIIFFGLAEVPWILAAGFTGPVSAGIVGSFTGALLAYTYTRNPFTIVLFGTLGTLAGVFLRQRYRTKFFEALRRSPVTALALTAVFPLLFLPAAVLWLGADLMVRLNFAFGLLLPETLAAGGSLLIAGVAGAAAARAAPENWGNRAPLVPSPAETSLETRSFQLMGASIGAAVLGLSIIGWTVAYASASDLVRNRMAGSAELAARSLPNALETGQSLVQIYLADPRLGDADPETAATALDDQLSTGLYFAQLMLVEPDGTIFAESVDRSALDGPLTLAETSGVVLAGEGVPFQYYSGEAAAGGAPSVISFIAPLPGSDRILIGRSLLAENPFIRPLLDNMQNLGDLNGRGILIDESGLILHHPSPAMVSTGYAGALAGEDGFSISATPEGEPAFVYAVPVDGRSWEVVVEVPVSAVQALAFRIAAPFMALLAFLAVASLGSVRVILRVVTGSLRSLAEQAAEIAETRAGIGSPIDISGEDEVGRTRAAFERMRASLKARMDEQSRLLEASHGVASSLDFSQAVKPVLKAAFSMGADSVRVVLAPEGSPDPDLAEPRSFGAGSNRFAYLDEQVLAIIADEPALVSRNPVGHPRLSFATGAEIPSGLAAVALRHDQTYLGAMWVGYANRHPFSGDEIRFLTALAAQASLAVANTRLFRSAQVGRERLAAILSSTPDPILVTDRGHRLFLANLAAAQVLGEGLAAGEGQPIETLLNIPNLVELIRSDPDAGASIEVEPASGGCYVARVTDFVFHGERFGKICILRDITRYKELDTLKSELVEHVGHDLGQPLTLIMGYATMLPVVGELNQEQNTTINRLIHGVGRMQEMVKNLVSMGKIEAGVGLDMVELSLVDLTIRTVQEIQQQALRKNVALAIAPPSEKIPPITGDEHLLGRAIGNLVDNAIKYTEAGGHVMVFFSVRQDGSLVRISVKDDGAGIALPDQDRLFERFFRGTNPEKKRLPGAGLGLAIVKSIVERHGGRVWVESRPGAGSTFHVELPAYEPPA